MLKGQKGITLVALVITIVVLIILAGISISMVLGQNGLFNKAKQGRENYAAAANQEQSDFTNVEKYIDDKGWE